MAKNNDLGATPAPEVAVPVQSAAGEIAMLALLKLEGADSRMSTWDGCDENGVLFQLKTCTSGQVTTARDVGPHTLKVWRAEHWVVAKGTNFKTRFEIAELRFLHPSWLEPKFKAIEAKINEALKLKEKVLKNLKVQSFSGAELDRLRYFLDRGATLNNPKIPWSGIVKSRKDGGYGGIAVPLDNAADRLRKLVKRYPVK